MAGSRVGAVAIDRLGNSRKLRARIWCHDSWSSCCDGCRPPVRPGGLVAADGILWILWGIRLVVWREHLLHASDRLHAFLSLCLGALRICLFVRDWFPLGGAGWSGNSVAGLLACGRIGGVLCS